VIVIEAARVQILRRSQLVATHRVKARLGQDGLLGADVLASGVITHAQACQTTGLIRRVPRQSVLLARRAPLLRHRHCTVCHLAAQEMILAIIQHFRCVERLVFLHLLLHKVLHDA